MNYDLFDFSEEPASPRREQLSGAAFVLRGFATPYAARLMPAIDSIVAAAPLRHMVTPGGFRMSVALTNCGALGWTSDRRGYRYSATDPASGQPWPAMPALFLALAQAAAMEAGFADFTPDACLINRYAPAARMTLHQDKDEHDFNAPIVSVSLGIPALFLFGGFERTGQTLKVPLFHGDVVVWGGPDRLRYHGILPVKQERHALTGDSRINVTFRKAG